MPYINCQQCNAKALAGATRCPRCSASFLEQVAGRGSYAPTRRNCTRCGEEQMSVHALCAACRNQDRAVGQHRRTMMMRGAAVAVASVALLVAVLVPSTSDRTAPVAVQAPAAAQAAPISTPPSGLPESALAGAQAASRLATPAGARPGAAQPSATVQVPAPVLAMANAAPTAPNDGEIHWVEAFASRSFYLRAAPDMNADIARVINAEELVLLGPTVAGWRRVRVGTMDGWAGANFFP